MALRWKEQRGRIRKEIKRCEVPDEAFGGIALEEESKEEDSMREYPAPQVGVLPPVDCEAYLIMINRK